ncbi:MULTISPECIES: ABC transporter permease [Bacillus]|uniref:ABC transporter permease n=1 Tax=Bacillus thuringiensis TaxID=1428 RepID=A0AB36TZT8_BACTU|nr:MULTISPECIES: ABC transporter permease [Bacillus]ANC09028.1 hypothetical protein WR47_18605 [Bacillus cereus]ANC14845.1 hypothetical protein WR51_18605 [Bacillus cereus]AVP47457.1 ABC transporter permease [Bacillus cereus]MBZ3765438.1 ABC transporter permease [Bacillus cereus]MDA1568636.1 ABC transporter permease [Bacillus cereus]
MRGLFISEFERLWTQKITWLILLFLPLMVVASVKYYLNWNQHTSPGRPDYVTALNFPIISISEHLVVSFNIIAIILISTVIAYEVENGQLRMILIRPFSTSQLFVAKLATILTTMFLYLTLFWIFNSIAGYLFFPKVDTLITFIDETKVSIAGAILYNLKYFFACFITMVCIVSVFTLIGALSRSTMITLGSGVAFIFFAIAIPQILEFSNQTIISANTVLHLMYMSIVKIQHTGIAFILSTSNSINIYIVIVEAIYIFLFGMFAYLSFVKRDYFI